ncbi:MAG TPA: hypothetical protein VMH90_03725, partial [Thermoplasmata archaeon]|nr:hypothetical protein [Thermoplasmata archaeon]
MGWTMTPNRPFPRVPAARLWLTLPVLLLVSSPAPAVLGAAVPGAHPSSSGNAQWAYGGNRSIDLTGAARNGSFALSSHVGYQVLFNATTGANGEVVLSSARTMGAVERIS